MNGDAVRLASEALWVDVLPAHGADVHAIIDRQTGLDLLWKSAWQGRWRPAAPASSRDRWIGATLGGWQLLMPNAGAEAFEGGRVWGFHGEAGMRAWSTERVSPDSLELALDLGTAPLSVRRAFGLASRTLSVTTTVTNGAAREVEFLWGEHPSFAEAIAADAVLEIDAEMLVVDVATNAPVRAGDRLPWARASAPDGPLATIPGREARRLLVAYLDGLGRGTYRLRNDARKLAVRVEWPLDLFPCVWLWEELTASTEAPWDGTTYAVGVEPQAAFPAVGMTEVRRRGGRGVRLGAGASVTGTVSLTVEALP